MRNVTMPGGRARGWIRHLVVPLTVLGLAGCGIITFSSPGSKGTGGGGSGGSGDVTAKTGAWNRGDMQALEASGDACAQACARKPAMCEKDCMLKHDLLKAGDPRYNNVTCPVGTNLATEDNWKECTKGVTKCIDTCRGCGFPMSFEMAYGHPKVYTYPSGSCACPPFLGYSKSQGTCGVFPHRFEVNEEYIDKQCGKSYNSCYTSRVTNEPDPKKHKKGVAICVSQQKECVKQAKAAAKQLGALRAAAGKGNLAKVKKLVMAGAKVHYGDETRRTVLHHAALNGQLKVVKYLVEDAGAILWLDTSFSGVKPWLPPDADGKTALDLAADSGHADVVEYLQAKLAEPPPDPVPEYDSADF